MLNTEKPKAVKPWSKEMYDWNDSVADLMKAEIKIQIESNKNDFEKLNELVTLCGGIRCGDGFSVDDIYLECIRELENVQNYWLNEEWDWSVTQGIVSDCMKIDFVGY